MKRKRLKWIRLVVMILAVVMIIGGATWFILREKKEETKIGGDGFEFNRQVVEDKTYQELKQGCSKRDCIPAISEPKFESIKEANNWLKDEELVLVYANGDEHRAYPQKIINWHEVVNDKVRWGEEERAIVITYCPLCGSVLGFEREIDGQEFSLGVSGKLKNNCLVMYDLETESLWEQITGRAIIGEMRRNELKSVGINMLTYGEWKGQFPSGKVLSRQTGYKRDYERYPYGNYGESEEVFYPINGEAAWGIHPKTEVYGLVINGEAKAYTKTALERETEYDGVLVDTVGGERVRLSFDRGEIQIENLSNKKEVMVPTRMFWFAWKAYYPEADFFD